MQIVLFDDPSGWYSSSFILIIHLLIKKKKKKERYFIKQVLHEKKFCRLYSLWNRNLICVCKLQYRQGAFGGKQCWFRVFVLCFCLWLFLFPLTMLSYAGKRDNFFLTHKNEKNYSFLLLWWHRIYRKNFFSPWALFSVFFSFFSSGKITGRLHLFHFPPLFAPLWC